MFDKSLDHFRIKEQARRAEEFADGLFFGFRPEFCRRVDDHVVVIGDGR